MHGRTALRGHFRSLAHPAEPVFEPSDDPILRAFSEVFLESGLAAFDANKHLRTGALTPIYDCETASCRDATSASERFVAVWSPIWTQTEPITGFRTGRDSAWLGSTPTVTMPRDERTAALLLLVTSAFVHLSGLAVDGQSLVQGAIDTGGFTYRFLTLDTTCDRLAGPGNRDDRVIRPHTEPGARLSTRHKVRSDEFS